MGKWKHILRSSSESCYMFQTKAQPADHTIRGRNEKLRGSLGTPCASKGCSFFGEAEPVANSRRAMLLGGPQISQSLCFEVARPPQRGQVSNPPNQAISRQPGLGCYLHVCDSFSQKDCNVWGVFFFLSFFLNAHLVWAVVQEIWGANIWCEEGLKSPGGGGGLFGNDVP